MNIKINRTIEKFICITFLTLTTNALFGCVSTNEHHTLACTVPVYYNNYHKEYLLIEYSAKKLINKLLPSDKREYTKNWFYYSIIRFDRNVDIELKINDELKTALIAVGCDDVREMRLFMLRFIYLVLNNKYESPKDTLIVVRDQIKNIDKAWRKSKSKS